MEFDFSALDGRITQKFGSRRNFCNAWGKSESNMSEKMNNKTNFSQDDIFDIIQPSLLDIETDQIGYYFFTPKVR